MSGKPDKREDFSCYDCGTCGCSLLPNGHCWFCEKLEAEQPKLVPIVRYGKPKLCVCCYGSNKEHAKVIMHCAYCERKKAKKYARGGK